MTETAPALPAELDAELTDLARRYRQAGGPIIQVLNAVGGRAENLIDRLPVAVRDQLGGATEAALGAAVRAAQGSRGLVGDQPDWINQSVAAAMGFAGGFGGLPSALTELPVTTTVLLRVIQGVAAEHGFDPAEENVAFDCLRVFAAAGPLAHDDGSDMGFLSARLTLTTGTVQTMIRAVAPRLAGVLGQKLAAQAVPVLGAVAGAATNYAYTSYYREMAHVHFAMRRLAIESDLPSEQLLGVLRGKVADPAGGRTG